MSSGRGRGKEYDMSDLEEESDTECVDLMVVRRTERMDEGSMKRGEGAGGRACQEGYAFGKRGEVT